MQIIPTSIPEVVIIEPRIFRDGRGYFFESFSEQRFAELVTPTHFVQDNESRSSYGVVRGLHFQLPPHAQAKLVRVVRGRVLDVAVDVRVGSPDLREARCRRALGGQSSDALPASWLRARVQRPQR